jgi:hypothetical protein
MALNAIAALGSRWMQASGTLVGDDAAQLVQFCGASDLVNCFLERRRGSAYRPTPTGASGVGRYE